MTKLTYNVVDATFGVLKTGIETYDEAKQEAKKYNAQIREVYTPIIEKYKRRPNLPISPEWKAKHPES